MEILLGADPEVFVRRGGKPFSAHGLIPGTKANPHVVDFGAVQVDGHALEFNIAPAKSSEQFVHNLEAVFKRLTSMIPEDCRIEITPSLEFDWDHLQSLPKEANELGCDPDFDAYTGNANPRPNQKTNLRTAAGHVHIGWTSGMELDDPAHLIKCRQLATQLDHFLGVPSVILDTDTKRRTMYGKAGAFRPKPYGMEYRVLSNFWLKSPELMKWVWDTTHLAIQELISGNNLEKMDRGGGWARYVIDYSSTPSACREHLNYYKNSCPKCWDKIQTYNHLIKKAA